MLIHNLILYILKLFYKLQKTTTSLVNNLQYQAQALKLATSPMQISFHLNKLIFIYSWSIHFFFLSQLQIHTYHFIIWIIPSIWSFLKHLKNLIKVCWSLFCTILYKLYIFSVFILYILSVVNVVSLSLHLSSF